MTLSATPCVGEVARASRRRPARICSVRTHQRDRRRDRRAAGVAVDRRGRSRPTAPAAAPGAPARRARRTAPARPRLRRPPAAGSTISGAPSTQVPCRRRSHRRPLAGRRERHASHRRPPSGGGNAAASAARVALAGSAAASAPSAAARRRPAPSSGTQPVEPDVAVGEGAGLVQADDVDPGQALDGGQLLHQRSAGGPGPPSRPRTRAGQQHQALGHHADERRDRARSRASRHPVLSCVRSWLHSTAGPTTSSVTAIQRRSWLVPVDQLRVGRGEPAGLGRQPGRVGRPPPPPSPGPGRAPATTIAPDQTSSPGVLDHGSASPVSSDSSTSSPVAVAHDAVGRHLVAGGAAEQVVEHHVGDRARPRSAPSRTTRARGALSTASRSRVRLARTSCTMPIAELTTTTMPKSPFCQRPVGQDEHEQRDQDAVEAGEDVGADDLADRAAGPHATWRWCGRGHPLGDAGRGQPGRRRLPCRRRRRPVPDCPDPPRAQDGTPVASERLGARRDQLSGGEALHLHGRRRRRPRRRSASSSPSADVAAPPRPAVHVDVDPVDAAGGELQGEGAVRPGTG